MSIEICKPFVSYVVQEQMRTDDADVFVFLLPLEIEDTNKTGEWRRSPWNYSDVQKAIDEKAGVDGLKLRRIREMVEFCRSVEQELAKHRERLYESPGYRILIRGPLR